MHGTLRVLAGTNGAGKSSLAGAALRAHGGDYFNPDEVTQQIRAKYPSLTQAEANSLAWTTNVQQLRQIIAKGGDYAFETTLGGRTIPRLIGDAARAGLTVRIWYVGLASVELHLARIAARVASGGHDIPEGKVRARYAASIENLVDLMPLLHELRVFDNSGETPLATSRHVAPKLVLDLRERRVWYPLNASDLSQTPDWAKALVAKAYADRK